MLHKFAIRIHVTSGERIEVPFGEIDAPGDWQDGFPEVVALRIVNRWNYIATLQSRVEFHYYVSTVEGAC